MKTKPLLLLAVVAMFFGSAFSQPRDIALQAYEMRMNGDPLSALAFLDSAVAVYPDSARIWFERGRTLDWIKFEGLDRPLQVVTTLAPRLRKSRHNLLMASRLEPENARYHYWVSQNAMLLSMVAIYSPWKWPFLHWAFKRAVVPAQKSVLFAPDNPEYRLNLITLTRFSWLLAGDKKAARAHADTLWKMDPVYGVRAYKELETKKEPYDAVAGYAEAGRQNPDHPWLLRYQAQSYSRKDSGRTDQAIACLKRLLEIDPDNTWAITQLYRVMPASRKEEAAVEVQAYLKRVDKGYNYYKAAGHQLMGQYYEAQHDSIRARESFELAKKYNPMTRGAAVEDLQPPGK